MRKLLVYLVFFFFYFQGFSQSYAYSFEGVLSNSQKGNLLNDLNKIQGIQNFELRYKSDSDRGEILFSINPTSEEGENDLDFSPLAIKEIFLQLGLTPIDFRQLK